MKPLLISVSYQVAAAGVNRLDLLQRKGQYPPPPGTSDILGVEGICWSRLIFQFIDHGQSRLYFFLVSGTVSSLSATAEENSGFKVGDKVMALIGGGGYAGGWRQDFLIKLCVSSKDYHSDSLLGVIIINTFRVHNCSISVCDAYTRGAHL